jgi:hypothetical protein
MLKHRFITPVAIFAAGFALSAVLDIRNLASQAKGTLSTSAAPASPAQLKQTPSALQLWDYHVVSNLDLRTLRMDEVDRELNRLGGLGYEIYSVKQTSQNSSTYLSIVLRRPKQ